MDTRRGHAARRGRICLHCAGRARQGPQRGRHRAVPPRARRRRRHAGLDRGAALEQRTRRNVGPVVLRLHPVGRGSHRPPRTSLHRAPGHGGCNRHRLDVPPRRVPAADDGRVDGLGLDRAAYARLLDRLAGPASMRPRRDLERPPERRAVDLDAAGTPFALLAGALGHPGEVQRSPRGGALGGGLLGRLPARADQRPPAAGTEPTGHPRAAVDGCSRPLRQRVDGGRRVEPRLRARPRADRGGARSIPGAGPRVVPRLAPPGTRPARTPVEYQVAGDRWRAADGWPPSGSRTSTYWLRQGLLSEQPTARRLLVTLQHEPDHPVPSLDHNPWRLLFDPPDRRHLGERDDVAAFDTEPLEAPLVLAGPPARPGGGGGGPPPADPPPRPPPPGPN